MRGHVVGKQGCRAPCPYLRGSTMLQHLGTTAFHRRSGESLICSGHLIALRKCVLTGAPNTIGGRGLDHPWGSLLLMFLVLLPWGSSPVSAPPSVGVATLFLFMGWAVILGGSAVM